MSSIRLAHGAAWPLVELAGELLVALGIIEIILHLPHRPVADRGSALLGLFVLVVTLIAVFFVPGYFRPVPAEVYSVKSPVMVLRGDRRTCLRAAAVRLVPLAAIWSCCGVRIGVAACVFGGAYLLFELFLGASASSAFVQTRALLAVTHRMPLRVLAFLEDAHQRGALGRTGSTYQFRHLQLQRHLARDHVRLPRRRAPGAFPRLPWSTGTWTHATWARRFEEQADALAGVIGPCQAAGPVYGEPPGVAQRFSTADGRDWVMCARPGNYPLLVSESVWSLLHHIRTATYDWNALEALGFPALPDKTPAGERIIAPGASRLILASGLLGPATLEQTGGGGHWHWHPGSDAHYEERLGSLSWETPVHVEMIIRLPRPPRQLVFRRPLADQLGTGLDGSEFSDVIRALGPWQKGYPRAFFLNSTYRYRWRTSTGSAPPVRAVMRVALHSWGLIVKAELDIAAGKHPQAGGSFRLGLSLQQLQAVLQAAWQAADEVIPGVTVSGAFDYPVASLTTIPGVSLSFSAPSTPEEIWRPRESGREARRVRFPRSTERAVAITGPVIGLSDAERERYIRDALARLAPGFGYQLGVPAD